MRMLKFRCDSGKTYVLPERVCLFCDHCTDIFWDYSHGIYMVICELDRPEHEFGNYPCVCKHFKEDSESYEVVK